MRASIFDARRLLVLIAPGRHDWDTHTPGEGSLIVYDH